MYSISQNLKNVLKNRIKILTSPILYKKYKEKIKKYRVLIIMISVFVVIGIIVYNLQFVIFRSLYESNNNVAKKVYSINNNNKKFKDSVDIMFSEETEEYINEYKKNEISYEGLNE